MFAVNLCAWGNSPSVSVVIDIPSSIILRIIDIVQNIAAGYFKGHSVAKSKQNNIHKTKLKCLSLPTYERDPAKRTFRVARRRQIACKDGLSTERSWNHSDQVCQEEHIRRIFPCTHCIQEQEYIEPMIYRGKMQSDLIIYCLHSHKLLSRASLSLPTMPRGTPCCFWQLSLFRKILGTARTVLSGRIMAQFWRGMPQANHV